MTRLTLRLDAPPILTPWPRVEVMQERGSSALRCHGGRRRGVWHRGALVCRDRDSVHHSAVRKVVGHRIVLGAAVVPDHDRADLPLDPHVDQLRQLVGDIAWFGRKVCDRAEGRCESSARELHERRLEPRWKLGKRLGGEPAPHVACSPLGRDRCPRVCLRRSGLGLTHSVAPGPGSPNRASRCASRKRRYDAPKAPGRLTTTPESRAQPVAGLGRSFRGYAGQGGVIGSILSPFPLPRRTRRYWTVHLRARPVPRALL